MRQLRLRAVEIFRDANVEKVAIDLVMPRDEAAQSSGTKKSVSMENFSASAGGQARFRRENIGAGADPAGTRAAFLFKAHYALALR